MVQVQSKFMPITTTCIEYVHPWTNSCSLATAELLVVSAQDSFRIYSIVYVLSLLMRGRIPTLKDLKRTISGMMQSTAFLTVNAVAYPLFLCMIRNIFGTFNILTIAYVPAFFASMCALLIERPSRRGLLTLYVANVATETMWNMLKSRNIVRSLPYGKCIIFALSTSILLYYHKRNLHLKYKDSIFSIISFAIGHQEIQNAKTDKGEPQKDIEDKRFNERSKLPFSAIQIILNQYLSIINSIKGMQAHPLCKHKHGCLYNALSNGVKLFSIGFGTQFALKLLLQGRKLFNKPNLVKKVFLNRDLFKLGLFFGGFSSIYRGVLCMLTHMTGKDDPLYAICGGLLASLAFLFYPDKTVALYVMWKMLQLTYNWGADLNYFPVVPGFQLFFYCASTALLFHAATLEPLNLRPSYLKFLHSLSGGRIAVMDRNCTDIWGLNTNESLKIAMKRIHTEFKLKFRL